MGVLVLRIWQSPRELKKVKKFGCGIETIARNSFLGWSYILVSAKRGENFEILIRAKRGENFEILVCAKRGENFEILVCGT